MDINLDLGMHVETILNKLALTLGTTVSHILSIYTKQAYLEGLFSVIGLSIFSIIFIFLIYCYFEKGLEEFRIGNDLNKKGVCVAISLAGIVICFLISVCCGVTWVMQIKNPEFYAIKELLSNFKGN